MAVANFVLEQMAPEGLDDDAQVEAKLDADKITEAIDEALRHGFVADNTDNSAHGLHTPISAARRSLSGSHCAINWRSRCFARRALCCRSDTALQRPDIREKSRFPFYSPSFETRALPRMGRVAPGESRDTSGVTDNERIRTEKRTGRNGCRCASAIWRSETHARRYSHA